MIENIWQCKIGGLTGEIPDGGDLPMRQAIKQAYYDLTGKEAEFCFSGWSAELTDSERSVVTNYLHEEVFNV